MIGAPIASLPRWWRHAVGRPRHRQSGSLGGTLSSGGAGDAAEDGSVHQPAAAGVVEIEKTADQPAGRVEPRDHLAVGVVYPGGAADLVAPGWEGQATGDGGGV